MHILGHMISRRLYRAIRDKHVQILRAFIILWCFAALGVVLRTSSIGTVCHQQLSFSEL